MVDTPVGPKEISSIQSGDIVCGAFGPSRVSQTLSRYAPRLVRVWLGCGRSVDCTPEHRFLTSMGWKNAIDLVCDDILISTRESLRGLRGGIAEIWKAVLLMEVQPDLRNKILQTMPWAVSPKRQEGDVLLPGMLVSIPFRARLHGQSQSQHGLRGDGKAHQRGAYGETRPEGGGWSEDAGPYQRAAVSKGNKVLDNEEGVGAEGIWISRQWNGTNPSGVSSLIAIPGRGLRADDTYRSGSEEFQAQNWDSALLPTGPGMAGRKAGRGSRWGNPDSRSPHPKGQAKAVNSYVVRVDRVEILQRSGDERYDESKGGYRVHNLEVEGHPSYSVGGCVVHNCGIKNKRLRAIFDEAQFCPRSFVDSISNLNKNTDFKCIVSGNPKDTTDALGAICEPAAHLGGWDGGIDQTGGTKMWETRFPRGVCIQLVGTDSPNLDGKMGIPSSPSSKLMRISRSTARTACNFQ